MASDGASPSKKAKTVQKEEKEGRFAIVIEDDRLSNLPDSLLGLILGSMETKYAVQTSVLAKRYKHLWKTSLLTLNFSQDSFGDIVPFFSFVYYVLGHRNRLNNILSFKYFRRTSIKSYLLSHTLRYVLLRNVEHLDIHATLTPHTGDLPSTTFASNKSLKTLHLKGQYCTELRLPVYFILPNLTTLHLEHVSFQSGDNSNKCSLSLLSCVNLKNLKLVYCEVSFYKVFHVICPPQLSNLTMSSYVCSCQTVISAPNLTSFNYTGILSPQSISWDNEPSFLENVNIRGNYPVWPDTQQKILVTLLYGLLMLWDLRHAKFLSLSGFFALMTNFVRDEKLPSPFINLKSLTVRMTGPNYSPVHVDSVAAVFLKNSPSATIILEGPGFRHQHKRLRVEEGGGDRCPSTQVMSVIEKFLNLSSEETTAIKATVRKVCAQIQPEAAQKIFFKTLPMIINAVQKLK